METKILPKPSNARCYKCGSTEIVGVCHHCGWGMCAQHATTHLPAQIGFFNALFVALGLKTLSGRNFPQLAEGYKRISLLEELFCTMKLARITNPEQNGYVFVDPPGSAAPSTQRWAYLLDQKIRKARLMLGLPTGRSSDHDSIGSYHCDYCVHAVTSYSRVIWVGLILLLVGILAGIAFNLPLVAIIGGLGGGGLIAVGLLLNQEFYIKAQVIELFPLSITGNPEKIRVSETLKGHIELDGKGEYKTQSDPIRGCLQVPIRFDKDASELQRAYVRKTMDLNIPLVDTSIVNVGYMVLGANNWKFLSGPIWMPGRVNIVKLNTSRLYNPLEALFVNLEQTEARWNIQYQYTALNNGNLPIQIVVSLWPESNRQAVELEFQLINLIGTQKPKAFIERLLLRIPNDLGKIERVEPEGKIDESSSDKPEYQTVLWKRLDFKRGGEANNPRRAIYIQFSEPIQETTSFEGELELTIPETLSKSEPARFFSPWGTPFPGKVVYESDAKATITFDIDFSSLRYQNLKLVKDSINRYGAIPDSTVIAEIVDTLSEQEFYIKRIRENPAKTSKEGAHIILRLWDISGRKYDGVYPVDFQLFISGEEVSGKPTASHLNIEINVQGDITNDAMGQRVEDVKDQLVDLLATALDKIPLASAWGREQLKLEASAVVAPATDGASNEDDGYTRNQGIPVEVVETTNPKVDILTPVVKAEDEERLLEIQRRIDLLEKNLLDGKISAEIYSSLMTKYEQELWDISGGNLGKPTSKTVRGKRTKR